MAKEKDVTQKTIKKDVAFDLAPTERQERLEELTKLENMLDDKKAELKEITTKFKATFKDVVESRNKIRKVLISNKEMRNVSCTEKFDFKKGEVTTLHDGKVIATRKMLDFERQTAIPMKTPPKKTEGKEAPLKASVGQIIAAETNRKTKVDASTRPGN